MQSTIPTITDQTLDTILTLQITVAWAGEALTDPPRLKWWRTAIMDDLAGADLFARLLPKTRHWAALEAVRAAAIQTDQKLKTQLANPDTVRTLFSWGFVIDEKLAERLMQHKHSLDPPETRLALDLKAPFDRHAFEQAIRRPDVKYDVLPSGRHVKNPPDDPAEAARVLAAALLPLADQYPLPFFRIRELA